MFDHMPTFYALALDATEIHIYLKNLQFQRIHLLSPLSTVTSHSHDNVITKVLFTRFNGAAKRCAYTKTTFILVINKRRSPFFETKFPFSINTARSTKN